MDLEEKRDEEEFIVLAHIYMPTPVRCAGGHLVIDGYVCSWCKSDNPQICCLQENVHSDYVYKNGNKQCTH